MEFLDGVTLSRSAGRPAAASRPSSCCPCCAPLLRDLGKLHESGVIHRDISPDNLMWMPDNTLKLLTSAAPGPWRTAGP